MTATYPDIERLADTATPASAEALAADRLAIAAAATLRAAIDSERTVP